MALCPGFASLFLILKIYELHVNPKGKPLVVQRLKHLLAMWEAWVQSLGWEDPLEKGKATHSSILAWRIPGTVSSMGVQRVGHDQVTFPFTFSQVGLGLPKGR